MAVAVSGSYAYVAGRYSKSLVVVNISNPASPAIRGSVISSSLLDEVRARACIRPVHHARPRGASACCMLMPSGTLTCSLSHALHAGL